MNTITIADVNARLCGLRYKDNTNINSINESMRVALQSNRVADIKHHIHEFSNYAGQVPFYSFIKLFESLIEKGSCSDIISMGDYIAENVVPKVRDAKHTNSLLKGRLTRMMHKITNPIKDAFADALSAFKVTSPISSPPANKDEAVAEAFITMLNKSIIMMHCDRVLENYNNISKRFNLDRIFVEDSMFISPGDIVVELCDKIDTYDMPTTIKFNTVIESAWYGFEHYHIPYNKSDILEAAVDYFLFKPDGLDACKTILESTLFFDKGEDMGKIDIFTEEEPEQDPSIDDIIRSEYNNHTETIKEDTSFKALFNKFKKEEIPKDNKPQNKLKKLISILYTKDIDSIINDTPDLLQWIRRFFIVGTCAIPMIGPVLAAVGLIVDKFVTMHNDRDQVSKMIKCFTNEIKASKNKLKATNDSQEKQRLEKYIKSLEDAKSKLTIYYNDLLTDKEQEKEWEKEDSSSDNDFDFDDDFSDLFEGVMFSDIFQSIKTIASIRERNIITEKSMFDLISNAGNEDVINIAKAAAEYPDLFFKDSVSRSIDNEIEKIRFTTSVSLSESIRLNSLVSAMYKLQKSSNNEDRSIESIYEAANEVTALADLFSGISIMIDTYSTRNTMLEGSFTNTLKVASMKLRNAMVKMSDKERSVSRSIDVGMNNFKKSIENSFTNDNREAIVKGSVLPSFSKIIKICIVNAGLLAFNVNPAIPIIGTLAYIAINGKFKHKERQMVIDEIEIELQMCEKYISIAEQKNDMKALKQLLTTKRELERQRQRIKYKMKVDFGQKYYDASSSN